MNRKHTAFNKISHWHVNVSNTIDDMETDPDADLNLHEYSYYVGAEHAFIDTLGVLRQAEAEAEAGRLSKLEKVAIAATVVGVAMVVYPTVEVKVIDPIRQKIRRAWRR